MAKSVQEAVVFSNATSDQLSQLRDIVQQLDRGMRSSDQENRRAAPRLNIRSSMKAFLLANKGQPELTVYSRNVSRSGIAFISRRPFGVGEPIAIAFNVPGQPNKLVLTETTFSRYVRAGMYEVGGKFIEAISDTRGCESIPPHWIPVTNGAR